jgi:hypothetical protein
MPMSQFHHHATSFTNALLVLFGCELDQSVHLTDVNEVVGNPFDPLKDPSGTSYLLECAQRRLVVEIQDAPSILCRLGEDESTHLSLDHSITFSFLVIDATKLFPVWVGTPFGPPILFDTPFAVDLIGNSPPMLHVSEEYLLTAQGVLEVVILVDS